VKPRVKICCISSVAEAHLAIRYGASALGLVSEMPSGPGVISEQEIAVIARSVPPPVATFLLTCRQDAASIIAQQRRCGTNTIQLCDAIDQEAYRALRDALPGVKLVQVVHVQGDESIAEAVEAAKEVDAILLDSGNPSLAVKELGGTGRRHDWRISARIREAVDVPLFLAGGLNAGNVAEAVEVVQPFGLDLCSSVRSEGKLDEAKLAGFFAGLLP
jgi:phosphoribosylanthranilate isomerase